MSIFESYVGRYPVQKTLRFELKPQEKTKEFLKTEEDAQRAEVYPDAKVMLDDYYRYFIEEELSKCFDSDYDASELFSAYLSWKTTKDKSTKNAYESLSKGLQKAISTDLKKKTEKDYDLKEYKNLFNREKSRLWKRVEQLHKNGEMSDETFNRYARVMVMFKGFVTYFSGFRNNRNNLFEVDKPTAISYRIIADNAPRYFDNCLNYAHLVEKCPDVAEVFVGKEKYFEPKNYFAFVSQKQIDEYNVILGNASDDVTAKGVNQLLNEYAQQHGLKRRDVPQMSVLYKQILSDREGFSLDVIKNDRELLCEVDKVYHDLYGVVDDIGKFVSDNLSGDLSSIFVMTKSLSDLSLRLFGGCEESWSVLGKAMNFYADSHKVKDKYKTIISLTDLQSIFDEYLDNTDVSYPRVRVEDGFKSFDLTGIRNAYDKFCTIKDLDGLSGDRTVPSENVEAGEGYVQTQIIKNLLDSFMEALHYYKPLYLVKDKKPIKSDEIDASIYNNFEYSYKQLDSLVPLYNKVRNYLSIAKEIDKTKVRNYFGKSDFFGGWGRTYGKNECMVFLNDEKYYLVIVRAEKGLTESEVKQLETSDGKAFRFAYKMQKPDNKTMPKNLLYSKRDKTTNELKVAPAVEKYHLPINDVAEIYKNGWFKTEYKQVNETLFKESLTKLIDYFKLGLSRHEDYKDFAFHFKESSWYNDISEFYSDAIGSCYDFYKVPADFEYLCKLEEQGKVFVFQIYNKDFSPFSKGTPNLHTLYLKAIFSDENIQNVKDYKPIFKLDGGAQIYTREASIPYKVTHKKNEPVKNKNPLNDKKESTFDYDLIKDKRFSGKKMFLHFPMTMNFRTTEPRGNGFNVDVNKFLRNNRDVNIIGLDRGERHLLYYSVINRQGEILEQGTLNTVTGKYDGGALNTDYHNLLDERETARDVARKTWGKIEKIKDIKAGYLSNIVHILAELMEKHNAVIVLENLNRGMKQSRVKVEKQVYQRFEHALIDKLNYLVFKDRLPTEKGGAMQGYQLTTKLNTFDDIGSQCGFLYYIDPAYTSKICPKTGFVNFLRPEYVNSKEFFSKFDDIRYNAKNDYFEFEFDYDKFGDYSSLHRKKWTACTYGDERYCYVKNDTICVNVTKELKDLFEKNGVDYSSNLKAQIVAKSEKSFFSRLTFLLKTTLQLRYTKKGTDDKDDYVLSPIADNDGKFFDSRYATSTEPENADANGAYHIALKGLWVLSNITEDGNALDCKREDWFAYRQK